MEFHHQSHLTWSEKYCLKIDVQIRYIIVCSNYWHESEFPLLLHWQWVRTICSLLNVSHWEAGKHKTKRRTDFEPIHSVIKPAKSTADLSPIKSSPVLTLVWTLYTLHDFRAFLWSFLHPSPSQRCKHTQISKIRVGRRWGEGHFINLLYEISTSTHIF